MPYFWLFAVELVENVGAVVSCMEYVHAFLLTCTSNAAEFLAACFR
jgi:hypothetical protein